MSEGLAETDIETLRRGAMGAGLLVSVSDRGFFDTFKEAGALAKHVAAARSGSESAVVREIAEGRGVGFGITSSPQEVESGTLDSLRSAVALLQEKAPAEVAAYRAFVLDQQGFDNDGPVVARPQPCRQRGKQMDEQQNGITYPVIRPTPHRALVALPSPRRPGRLRVGSVGCRYDGERSCGRSF